MLKREGGERCLPHSGKNLRNLILKSTSCTLQDCLQCRASKMKPTSATTAQRRPNPSTRRPRAEISSNAVFGFPVSTNPFNVLQESEFCSVYQSSTGRRQFGLPQEYKTTETSSCKKELKNRELCLVREFFETIAHWSSDEQGIATTTEIV